MADALRAQLKVMIVERLFLSVSPSDVDDDANLMDEYGLDSINLFEITVGLEEDLGLELGEDDFSVETFSTVANIARLVEDKRGQ